MTKGFSAMRSSALMRDRVRCDLFIEGERQQVVRVLAVDARIAEMIAEKWRAGAGVQASQGLDERGIERIEPAYREAHAVRIRGPLFCELLPELLACTAEEQPVLRRDLEQVDGGLLELDELVGVALAQSYAD